jgi:chromosome partitioning protein
VVPRNIRLAEAPSHGIPVLQYDIKSRGAQAYLGLARELLPSLTASKGNQRVSRRPSRLVVPTVDSGSGPAAPAAARAAAPTAADEPATEPRGANRESARESRES